MSAVERCRTEALGGHLEACDHCQHQHPSYNSCRNRHCPKCQCLAKARWLEAREAELLPVKYFHLVFTLPHELNPLILRNQQVLLKLLFQATSQTLLEFGADRKHLGGQLGFLAVLHTWSQELLDHFHLHIIIPAGALSKDDGQWIGVESDFLFPVKALSKKFRGKYLALLKKAFEEEHLQFPGKIAGLESANAFDKLIGQLYGKKWVVYAKKPFENPEYVVDYLGRYTHRVAIANHRIVSVEKGMVRFTVKNRKTEQQEIVELRAEEFIRRFLLHVLPDGFVKIRFFGFLAHCHKAKKLNAILKALEVDKHYVAPEKKSTSELITSIFGKEINLCPVCRKGTLQKVRTIPQLVGVGEMKIEWSFPENKDSS